MHFSVKREILENARGVFIRKEVYWVVGGSCSGKSTVCRAIAKEYGLTVYDVDKHLFEEYPDRCTVQRHPALRAWFSAADPFAWMLGLSDEELREFNLASTAEQLDLISEDLGRGAPGKRMLVDGGISSPIVLAQVAPVNRVVCLSTTEELSIKAWEENAERRSMKDMVFRLPEPEKAWRKFLHLDTLMTRTMLEECAASGIRVFARSEGTEVQEFARRIWEFLEKGRVR